MNTPHLTGGVRQVQHLHGSDHRPWLGHTCLSAVNKGHKRESSKTFRVKMDGKKGEIIVWQMFNRIYSIPQNNSYFNTISRYQPQTLVRPSKHAIHICATQPFSASSRSLANSSWRRFTCSGPMPKERRSLSFRLGRTSMQSTCVSVVNEMLWIRCAAPQS